MEDSTLVHALGLAVHHDKHILSILRQDSPFGMRPCAWRVLWIVWLLVQDCLTEFSTHGEQSRNPNTPKSRQWCLWPLFGSSRAKSLDMATTTLPNKKHDMFGSKAIPKRTPSEFLRRTLQSEKLSMTYSNLCSVRAAAVPACASLVEFLLALPSIWAMFLTKQIQHPFDSVATLWLESIHVCLSGENQGDSISMVASPASACDLQSICRKASDMFHGFYNGRQLCMAATLGSSKAMD